MVEMCGEALRTVNPLIMMTAISPEQVEVQGFANAVKPIFQGLRVFLKRHSVEDRVHENHLDDVLGHVIKVQSQIACPMNDLASLSMGVKVQRLTGPAPHNQTGELEQ